MLRDFYRMKRFSDYFTVVGNSSQILEAATEKTHSVYRDLV